MALRTDLPAFLHPFATTTATEFTTITRGVGARVYDSHGNEYVDALASLWYCNVGHGRREISAAVAKQLETLGGYHTFDRFTNEPAEQLCELLADLAPMPDARVFLTSSGSEAVDSALKLARLAHSRAGHPQRTVVIGRRLSYHGVTYGGVSVQGLPLNKEGFGPLLADTVQVDHDDLDAMRDAVAAHEGRVAAIIAEPVIGAGGVIPPPSGYLKDVREICDGAGAFLILDEVICGFGRLQAMWGSQKFGVRPDLVTFAKGVTSGYQPLGGVLVGGAVREPLESEDGFLLRHGHTYSGHPAACTAALVNIELLREEGLPARAAVIGNRIDTGLRDLEDRGLIAGHRGTAAIWAAVLPDGLTPASVRDAMLERGVIARPLGSDVIAFCPPLVIGDDDIDRCVAALGAAVEAGR